MAQIIGVLGGAGVGVVVVLVLKKKKGEKIWGDKWVVEFSLLFG